MGTAGYSVTSMGLRSRSGFYMSRRVVAFLVLLLVALLGAVIGLSYSYARCSQTPLSEKPKRMAGTPPPTNLVLLKQEIGKEKKAAQMGTTHAPETRPSSRRPVWSWNPSHQSTTGPPSHQRLSTTTPRDQTRPSTIAPRDHPHLSTFRPWAHSNQSTTGSPDHPNRSTSGPLEHVNQSTSEPLEHLNQSTSGPLEHLNQSTSGPLEHLNQSTSGPLEHLSEPTSGPLEDLSEPTSEPLEDLSEPTSEPLEDLSEPTSEPLEDLSQSTSEHSSWQHPRLPPDVVPLHYDLELWSHLQPDNIQQSAKSFSGRLNITVLCVSSTPRVVLHSLQLEYEVIKVLGPLPEGPEEQRPVGQVPVNNLRKDKKLEFLEMELGETLKPGRHYVLEFHYSGSVQQFHKTGFFMNYYSDQRMYRGLIASHMEPTFARMVFPCFDEPALKATFNVTIVHHPTYVALSNMPALGTSEREDANGTKWSITRFDTTLLMSTYLMAFAVCDYDYLSSTERGKEVRVWARKEKIANGKADFALNITGPTISNLEDLFNISYPLPKMDLIGFPFLDQFAMENWGLVTFDELLLLDIDSDNFLARKMMILFTVTHELSHQWFGNLVTLKWWNDLWLNEGFASYFEFQMAKKIEPQVLKFQNEIFYFTYMKDAIKSDHSKANRTVSTAAQKVTEQNQILFDSFVYLKGACLIRMLSDFISENLFIRGLQSYLKTFAYSNAEQDDLWNHFQMVLDNQSEIVLPTSLKNIMDRWTHHSGFPIITLNVTTGTVIQEPFYLPKDKNQMTSTHNNTWIVPIVWMKNGTLQPLVWLDNSSNVFPEMQLSGSDDDWVIINVNISGYYRVNYDQLGWKKIGLLLERDPKAIPPIQKLQLINDAFTLAQNDYIGIETVLDLTKYLSKEEDLIVWNSFLSNLITNAITDNLNNYDIYALLKKYLLKKLTLVWNIYSTKIRENDSALQQDYSVVQSLKNFFETVCWLGLEDCLQLSREIFSKWMSHPESNKPVELIRSQVMCFGVAMGSDREWDFLLSLYNSTEDENERNNILKAMSCSKEPWILYRYLGYALNTPLFKADQKKIIENVALSEIGRFVTRDFLIHNWKAVRDCCGGDFLVYVAEDIAKATSTDSEIKEVGKFFGDMLQGQEKITLQDALHVIKNRNLQSYPTIAQIANWLRKNIAS